MGNCQAVDAATLVIQHPSGKVENLYWPVSASEVMKMNPGHYVALLLSTTLYSSSSSNTGTTTTANTAECPKNSITDNRPLRITRIKLLRPTDTLVLGHCYRLITTQEVMKGIMAKKQAKLKKEQPESDVKPERVKEKQETKAKRSELENDLNQVAKKSERTRARTATSAAAANSAIAARSRAWQPSLNSISEAGSGSGSGSGSGR